MPRFVSLPADPRCKKTGSNPAGGELISCNVQGPSTNIAPGATLKGDNTFTVASNAPAHSRLGPIGVLATPLKGDGQPAEDWTDIHGYNVTWSSRPLTSDAGFRKSSAFLTTITEWRLF